MSILPDEENYAIHRLLSEVRFVPRPSLPARLRLPGGHPMSPPGLPRLRSAVLALAAAILIVWGVLAAFWWVLTHMTHLTRP